MSLFDWLLGRKKKSRRSYPKIEFPISEVAPSKPAFTFRSWPLVRIEASEDPLYGADFAVPWFAPLSPAHQAHTYWGRGPATTSMMTTNDASLRIVAAEHPISIIVKRADGTIKDDIAECPVGVFSMAQLLDQGTFCLQIDAVGSWGITVVTEAKNSNADYGIKTKSKENSPKEFRDLPLKRPLSSWQVFEQARSLSGKLSQREPSTHAGIDLPTIHLLTNQWFWGERSVVVVSSANHFICFPARADSNDSSSIIPREPRLNIAVISSTVLREVLSTTNDCIPFLGYLMEFAGNGHTVWVFDGHASQIEAGCQDADLLLVDGATIPHLSPDWQELASRKMRGRELWVHDRERYALTKTVVGFFDADVNANAGTKTWTQKISAENAVPKRDLHVLNKQPILVNKAASDSQSLKPAFDQDGQPMGAFAPHMPKVDSKADIKDLINFASESMLSVTIQTSDGKLHRFEFNSELLTDAMTKFAESVLPSEIGQRLAVLTFTDAEPFQAAPNVCIPFLGMLTLLARSGNPVMAFEGQSDRLFAGCRDADILLVDWGILDELQDGWQEIARSTMRGDTLWLYDRERHQIIKTVLGNLRVAGKGLVAFSDRDKVSMLKLPPDFR